MDKLKKASASKSPGDDSNAGEDNVNEKNTIPSSILNDTVIIEEDAKVFLESDIIGQNLVKRKVRISSPIDYGYDKSIEDVTSNHSTCRQNRS